MLYAFPSKVPSDEFAVEAREDEEPSFTWGRRPPGGVKGKSTLEVLLETEASRACPPIAANTRVEPTGPSEKKASRGENDFIPDEFLF